MIQLVCIRRMLIVAVACFVTHASFPSRVAAHPVHQLPDSIIHYWHEAYFAEIANDPDGIIAAYSRILELSRPLPERLRLWFDGSAYFGIAKALALIGDREQAQQYLDSALHKHFWNFDMIRNVPSFPLVLGKAAVDSLCRTWRVIAEQSSKNWPRQDPIFIKPTHLQPGRKYPTIVGLHGGGGSYELFGYRLGALPDSLGVILVMVPGPLRINEVANAWGMDMSQCVPELDAWVNEIVQDPNVDAGNISLLGYSQGSQVAYAYALAHPDRVRQVIAFAGFAQSVLTTPNLTEQLRVASEHHVHFTAISGDKDYDEFVKTTRELQELAKEEGVRFHYVNEPGLPHGLPENSTEYIIKLWRSEHPAELQSSKAGSGNRHRH